MFIIGTKAFSRTKSISKDLLICHKCGLKTHFELIHSWRWFTFFFIPIFPYWVSRVIVCPHCGSGFRVKRSNEYEVLAELSERLEHADGDFHADMATPVSAQPARIIGFAPVEAVSPEHARLAEVRKQIAPYQGCIAAGGFHTLAVQANGVVVADGNKKQCQLVEGWEGIVKVAAGSFHSVGIRRDGTIATAGGDKSTFDDINTWTDIVAIDVANSETVGLKADGTVVGVGLNSGGGVKYNGWRDITAISTGGNHTLGLQADGTVVAMGRNKHGECNTGSWKDIVGVAAAGKFSLGLRSDGTIMIAGKIGNDLQALRSWSDIVAIAAEESYVVGLTADGDVRYAADVCIYGTDKAAEWHDIVAISPESRHVVGLKRDGTVVAVGKKTDGINTGAWRSIGPAQLSEL